MNNGHLHEKGQIFDRLDFPAPYTIEEAHSQSPRMQCTSSALLKDVRLRDLLAEIEVTVKRRYKQRKPVSNNVKQISEEAWPVSVGISALDDLKTTVHGTNADLNIISTHKTSSDKEVKIRNDKKQRTVVIPEMEDRKRMNQFDDDEGDVNFPVSTSASPSSFRNSWQRSKSTVLLRHKSCQSFQSQFQNKQSNLKYFDWRTIQNQVKDSVYLRYEHQKLKQIRNLPHNKTLRRILALNDDMGIPSGDSIDVTAEANLPGMIALPCSPPLINIGRKRRLGERRICKVCLQTGGHKPWCHLSNDAGDTILREDEHKNGGSDNSLCEDNVESQEMPANSATTDLLRTNPSETRIHEQKKSDILSLKRKHVSDIHRRAYIQALSDVHAKDREFSLQTTRAFVFSYFSDSACIAYPKKLHQRKKSGMKLIFGNIKPDRYYHLTREN